MKKLREWWYAFLVCHKYNLSFSPFKGIGKGSYNWATREVEVNPFSKDFLSIFMHEVGHHIHHNKVNYDEFLMANEGSKLIEHGVNWDVMKSWEAEWCASRFAAKSGKANKAILTKWFNTYTSSVFKQSSKRIVASNIWTVVDASHKGWLKINK